MCNWVLVAPDTYRLVVPGGWLYKVTSQPPLFADHGPAIALCFVRWVPDSVTLSTNIAQQESTK